MAVGQPSRSYRGRAQHRIAAAAPRRHAPARRGHQYQWQVWRTQLGERARERPSEWHRQIPPAPFLRGEHRPARRPGIRPERPARNAGVAARPHPHRWTGQRDGAVGAPIGSRTSAARTGGGQDQIEQGSHRKSVRSRSDRFARAGRRRCAWQSVDTLRRSRLRRARTAARDPRVRPPRELLRTGDRSPLSPAGRGWRSRPAPGPRASRAALGPARRSTPAPRASRRRTDGPGSRSPSAPAP